MAVRIADTLKQQNDLTSFPIAYADGIWVSVGDEEFKTLQELYAQGALGGGDGADLSQYFTKDEIAQEITKATENLVTQDEFSELYELSFDESTNELTLSFNR